MLYNELLAKYEALLLENAELKRRLGLEDKFAPTDLLGATAHQIKCHAVDEPAVTEAHVNSKSSIADKIELFMSLFRGRQDVYAKRWSSAKQSRSGYQPVCGNEWAPFFCDKRKNKCNACPNGMLLPLESAAIESHLRGNDELGRDVVGIYPLLPDDSCYFLAVDFDEEGFRDDVSAFRDACKHNSVPVHVEISRSGLGAHAWVFFEDKVPASVARRLGSGLLTCAMNTRSDLKFASYDRLFPNQDTMPTGGFGNLIALPLQGLARKHGGSLFVDDAFLPYADQWQLLSSIHKLSGHEVEKLVSHLCPQGDLGELASSHADEEPAKPWEKARPVVPLQESDFPAMVSLTRANMLYVAKVGFSTRAINKTKRLAAFRNPDFYKAQAMRLPTYNKPRIIATAEETADYIALPRGCEAALLSMLDEARVAYSLQDETHAGQSIETGFVGTLRDAQQAALDALLTHNTGVLAATTAFGKTVIGAKLIATRKTNTLVLVHTAALLEQWQKALEQFLDISFSLPTDTELPTKRGRKKITSSIGILGSGKSSLNGRVDVAIMQSLFEGDSVKELVRNYGQIIIDECHHVSAVNFERILKFATARFVYGLTATPTRQDGHHPIIFMQCGAIRYTVDAKAQAEIRPFEHYLVPRFTSFKKISDTDTTNITALYADLCTHEIRNRMIADDVVLAIADGRNPIVLTERAQHVARLAEMLADRCEHVIQLVGSMSDKSKRQVFATLSSLPMGIPCVLIATGKYVGEGFDFPRLDTLFLALPIAWKGKVAQYAGRLHRLYEGKNDVRVYDYIDVHVPVLERMYHKRVKGYAAIGYKTLDERPTIESPSSIIYDNKSFLPVWLNDLLGAKNEIVIVSPYMSKHRTEHLARTLATAIINGAKVIVVTRPPEDYTKLTEQANVREQSEYLQSANISVVYKSAIHQKFTVIDQALVWYGSINFLSFGKSQESIMRIANHLIAHELLGTL